jgi:hypothetical protein
MMHKPLVPEELHRGGSLALRSLARACLVAADRTVNQQLSVTDAMRRRGWSDDRVAPLLTRAASSPTSTTSAAALGQVGMSLVSSLIPVSAAAGLIDRALQVSLDGEGSVSVPSLSLPTADFVGQGAPIPVAQGTSASVTVSPHKLSVITTATRELLER